MANTFQGFLPRRALVIGLFAFASLGVACGSSVSSGPAAGGAGGKGAVGGAGGSGGLAAVPCTDPFAIKNGDPCDHPHETCGNWGTGCYPVIACYNGVWNTSTYTCSAGSGAGGAGGSGTGTGTTSAGGAGGSGTGTGTTGTGG